jgi:hypothetical protein
MQKHKRYYYSTVGYGVMTLLGERYRMGRIEIFDRDDDSGYQIGEGAYCMPFEAAAKFEDFIEELETDLPIQIDIGSVDWCQEECARDLGLTASQLRDPEAIKEYYKKKYEE